jgi:CheY-like chemotaxis protein
MAEALPGCSILVVEDEPLIALDLRRCLENSGTHVFAATQLAHGVLLADHPDLSGAVLDYRLGADNVTPICARLEERGIPFIFYSAYDEMHERWPHAVRVPKPAPDED